MVSPTELRAFHAVATERSFTAAARALRLTQPTISAHVSSLEEAHGVQLFDRHGRGARLTELGQALLELTRPFFALEEAADELLGSARELEAGHLLVGADGPHHVMAVVRELTRRHPGLDISIITGNANHILRELLAHRIDVAVVACEPDDPRIATIADRYSELVAFVGRSHPWAARSTVTLTELCAERLVLREPSSVTRQIFLAATEEAGLRPRAVLQVDSREGVLEAVVADLGVGVVSEAEIGEDDRVSSLRIADAQLRMTEHWLCLHERHRLQVVSACLQIVRGLAASSTSPGTATPGWQLRGPAKH